MPESLVIYSYSFLHTVGNHMCMLLNKDENRTSTVDRIVALVTLPPNPMIFYMARGNENCFDLHSRVSELPRWHYVIMWTP